MDLMTVIVIWVICGLIGGILMMKIEVITNNYNALNGVEMILIELIGIVSGVIGLLVAIIILILNGGSITSKFIDFINKRLGV